jgi:hypothetical protein
MRWLSGDRRGSRHFVSRSIAEKRVVAVGFFQGRPAHSVSIRRWSRYGTACIRERETADDGIACADHSTFGRTPVLDPSQARALLDSIDTSTHAGLRDRALIGLMVYREIHCGQVFRKMQAVRLPDLVRMADKFGIAKA